VKNLGTVGSKINLDMKLPDGTATMAEAEIYRAKESTSRFAAVHVPGTGCCPACAG
jgi:hypothetical protein